MEIHISNQFDVIHILLTRMSKDEYLGMLYEVLFKKHILILHDLLWNLSFESSFSNSLCQLKEAAVTQWLSD